MTPLITGANRGVGLHLLQRYAALGDSPIGTSRSDNTPQVSGARWQRLEVSDTASHRELAERLARQPIDLLICNAGIYPDKAQRLENGFPAEMWAETFAVNVTGVFLTIQALLPNLRLSSEPKIAIISSQMGSDTRAPGGSYIYRASKAAVLNLGRNLAVDLKPQGIAVGIYHPGWVQTDMGGKSAAVTPDQSARGLIARFGALGLATTGCFETWDGQAHPF